MWSAALIPETPLDTNVAIPPLDDAVKQALAAAPGTGRDRARPRHQCAEYAPGPARPRRPRIDAFANLTAAGLAGTAVPVEPVPGRTLSRRGRYVCRRSSTAATGSRSAICCTATSPPRRSACRSRCRCAIARREAQAAIAAAEGRRLQAVENQIGMAIEADVRNALQAVNSSPRAPGCRRPGAPLRRRAVRQRAAPVPGRHVDRLPGAAAADRPDRRAQPRSPRAGRFRRSAGQSRSRHRPHHRSARHQTAVSFPNTVRTIGCTSRREMTCRL